jgi:integrase
MHEGLPSAVNRAYRGKDNGRQMVPTELMGGHSHRTLIGVQVHVWRRGGKFLARGRYQGRPFGETLGEDPAVATARLRQLLTEIEDGSYVRPCEARKRMVSSGRVPRWTLRQLVSAFLAEKRQLRGKQTAGDYLTRLRPVLEFAERPENRRRWPLAADIDREFALALRAFLFECHTTRNGRPGGKPKKLTSRQVINVLECLRAALLWARKAEKPKLPAGWSSPLTQELIGVPPPKDPLREDKLPPEVRARVVGITDPWQLCQLSMSLVLPLRPDEAAGLLVADVNFEKGWMEIGAGAVADNFTKARQSFKLPFPKELTPILQVCIGRRVAGPLLRSRKAFTDDAGSIGSAEELKALYEARLLQERADSVQNEHDRKRLFRRLLRDLGGVSEDALNKEFK